MKTLSLFLIVTVMTLYTASASAIEALNVAERQAGHFESWVALGIILTSITTSWFLNHNAPKVRVFGTLLSSLGCFVLAAWFFFFVLQTGFLENPKPNQTPLDSAKPALLWGQAFLAFAVGLALLAVAVKQRKNTQNLALRAVNEKNRYGRVSRVLHWTIAILFLALIPMGIFASIIPEGTPYRVEYYVVHKTIGVIVFVLVIFRLVWNKISLRPQLESSLKPIERKMAHATHLTLYIMMVLVPVTGFIMTSYHGAPTFFFAWQLDPLWSFSQTGTIAWGMLHKYFLPYFLYIILGAHILGAIKHHFVDKHTDAIKRMVS